MGKIMNIKVKVKFISRLVIFTLFPCVQKIQVWDLEIEFGNSNM